jgi:geranylgeranyl reductase family protein
VLIEKYALPRYKPCGGGVPSVIAQWFDFDFSPVIACKVDQICCTWKLGDPVDTQLKTTQPMWMVYRDQFDHFLVQQAQAQGAKLLEQTTVTGVEFKQNQWLVQTNQGTVVSRYLIAADGASGSLSRWLGFKLGKPRSGVITEATGRDKLEQACFEFGLVKNGYIWRFPKPNGYSLGAATFRGGEPNDLQATVQDYAAQAGLDLAANQWFVHGLRLWDGARSLHTHQALLAGEAACMVDPLTAEGIRPAIFTGVKAAAAIDASLSGDPTALETYTTTVQQEWGTDMLWAQRLAGLFYRVPGVGYRLGIKRPGATDRFGQILCGQLRYSDVADRVLKRLGTGILTGAN